MSARLELKYVVDLDPRRALEPVLHTRLVRGEYADRTGGYPVLSLYYDGSSLPLYFEKLTGIERRMKVRLRTYGWRFDPAAVWFLEAKHKDGPAIAKRRLPIDDACIDPLRPETWDALGPDAAPFLHARESLRLEPTAQVWYQREVLVSPALDLRITFDSPVRALFPGDPIQNSVDRPHSPRSEAFQHRVASRGRIRACLRTARGSLTVRRRSSSYGRVQTSKSSTLARGLEASATSALLAIADRHAPTRARAGKSSKALLDARERASGRRKLQNSGLV